MLPSFLTHAKDRGWDVKRLDELISEKAITGHLDGNHGNLYPRASEFVDKGIKYISANSLIGGKVDLSKSKYLTGERGSKFKKGVAIDGDVLFAHNATVGPVAVLNTNDDYVILSTSLTYYRCNKDTLDNKYLCQYMASPSFMRQYEKIMKQTTRNQIPITAQRDFYFVVPPLPEQRKIAKILFTWDKAISTTEALIDNSKQQKKALMQQLLTGKKRFAGFEGEWGEVKLGSVLSHQKGYAFKSQSYIDKGVRIIRISDTTRNSIHDKDPVYFDLDEAKNLSSYLLESNDIILSTVGSRPHLLDSMVGKAVLIPDKDNGSLLNQNLVKLKPNGTLITNDYLYSLLKKVKFNYFISTLVRGNANQVSITLAELFSYRFLLPSVEEQQKIASVLTNADKETELLEKQLADLKYEKKALMQQLLTGKRRVKINDMEKVA